MRSRRRIWSALPLTFIVCLLVAPAQSAPHAPEEPLDFSHSVTFEQFIQSVRAQRELWMKNAAQASVAPDLVERFKRVARGLAVLVVAEDWCPDSVATLPYFAALAARSGVMLRIVDRAAGEPLMRRHPAPDGRRVTPTAIVVRDGVDVGAWIERPAVLQRLFQTMATNAEHARQFADRQAWYEADHGRTALAEFVALVERSAGHLTR